MTETDRVRELLTVAADDMPGGPVVPPAELTMGSGRLIQQWKRPWVMVVAASVLVLVAVAGPTWLLRKPVQGPVVLPGYAVPTASAYPTAGAGTADALAHGAWNPLPAAPIEGRTGAATVWTGHEMIVWGGRSTSDSPLGDGAAYDPATAQWRRIAMSPLAPRSGAAAVWTGQALLIWGGDGGGALADGALYDPASDTWRVIADSPLTARGGATALWTGGQVLVIGGMPIPMTNDIRAFVDGAIYDPGTDRWTTLPTIEVESGQHVHDLRALATPGGVLAWVYWSHTEAEGDGGRLTTGGILLHRYDPTTGRWNAVAADQPMDIGNPLWTGSEVILPAAQDYRPGGRGPMPFNLQGWRMTPDGGHWTRIPHGPVDDLRATSVWTGAALLSVDTHTEIGYPDGTTIHPGQAAVWDPQTSGWKSLPPAPLVTNGEGASVVWTGRELLMWGIMAPPGNSNAVTAGLRFGPDRAR